MSALSHHDRRVVVAGALVIGTLITITRAIPIFRGWSEEQLQRAAATESALARAQANALRQGQTSRGLAEVSRRLAAVDSAFLTGTTAAAAGTALSEAISEAAAVSGAELGSIQLRKDTLATTHLTHVAATVSLTGDIEALALFLQSIDAGPPLLAIRQLSISGSGMAAMPATGPEVLHLEALVDGVFRRSVTRKAP
jgi:hypothetical protein